MELQIKKVKPNGGGAKQPAIQKPCEKMTDAIVVDGGTRGQIVKVCADPNCKVHHGDRLSPQQLQRDRQQEPKRIEKEKTGITPRHRILAAVLERVSVPLKKADLLTIAQHVLASVPYNRLPVLAKHHKLESENSKASPVELLQKHVSRYDETGLSRLLLEISLLESAYRNGGDPDSDVLLSAAKRYRIDCEKVHKAVARSSPQNRGRKRRNPRLTRPRPERNH